MTKIKSKVFNYGDKDESSWPPRFGKRGPGRYYWDETEKKMKPGYPPVKHEKIGQAPLVFMDDIEPYYHPKAQRIVTTRKELAHADRSTGTFTTDKEQIPDFKYAEKKRNEALRADVHQATQRAIAAIDSGMAPLSEQTKEICKAENERVSKALGFDAFNFAGRKNDSRGKKYRRD